MEKSLIFMEEKHEMTFHQVGKIVKQARIARRLTQQEAAKLCKISLRTYQSIERGEGTAGFVAYDKVAIYLDTSFSIDFPIRK